MSVFFFSCFQFLLRCFFFPSSVLWNISLHVSGSEVQIIGRVLRRPCVIFSPKLSWNHLHSYQAQKHVTRRNGNTRTLSLSQTTLSSWHHQVSRQTSVTVRFWNEISGSSDSEIFETGSLLFSVESLQKYYIPWGELGHVYCKLMCKNEN
jgi:hypothetical protein